MCPTHVCDTKCHPLHLLRQGLLLSHFTDEEMEGGGVLLVPDAELVSIRGLGTLSVGPLEGGGQLCEKTSQQTPRRRPWANPSSLRASVLQLG